MGLFDDLFDEVAWPEMLDKFEQEVTYRHADYPTTADQTINVVFAEQVAKVALTQLGDGEARETTVLMNVSDVSDPELGDRIIKDSETWEVRSVEKKTGGRVRLKIVRYELTKRSHEDYYQQRWRS